MLVFLFWNIICCLKNGTETTKALICVKKNYTNYLSIINYKLWSQWSPTLNSQRPRYNNHQMRFEDQESVNTLQKCAKRARAARHLQYDCSNAASCSLGARLRHQRRHLVANSHDLPVIKVYTVHTCFIWLFLSIVKISCILNVDLF